MSIRIQVILSPREADLFKSEAVKASKSLSAWLKEAGLRRIEERKCEKKLDSEQALQEFFEQCRLEETGSEPDWDEHKSLILAEYQAAPKT